MSALCVSPSYLVLAAVSICGLPDGQEDLPVLLVLMGQQVVQVELERFDLGIHQLPQTTVCKPKVQRTVNLTLSLRCRH